VPVADLFEVSESDTVWDAWLTTVNLLDMLEHTHRVGQQYDFAQVRNKVAEAHAMDKQAGCKCGLSDAEHTLLRRKVLTFFKLQVANMKHFVY
jgi:hypothetical protein